jgi:O-antigen ligase
MVQEKKDSQVLNPLASLLGITGFIVTSFYWYQGTDPVNAPKLALLGVGTFAVIGLLVTNYRIVTNSSSKFVLTGASIFLIGLFVSISFADANVTQMINGVYGRNTGFLAYFAFIVLFLASQLLQTSEQIIKVLKYFMLAVIFNQAISLLQIMGLNPLNVNDIFGTIVGTFGNPNFISAFMGMSTVMFIAYSFKFNWLSKPWLFISTNYMISIVLVIESNSKQGLIIVLAGAMLILFFWLYYSKVSRIFVRVYFAILLIASLFGLLGVANRGPLASLIYESSIGFRVRYWIAGLEMFENHFFQGVGLNSYGDWYRASRDAKSMVAPGVEVTSNSAHNIYIDYAANGGILLILGYSVIAIIILFCSYRAFRKSSKFDPILTTLFVGWFGYSLQGLVSIDQIGLTVWGWLLGGLLVSYSKIVTSGVSESLSTLSKQKGKEETTSLPARSVLGIFVFALIGGTIYFQSFLVDIKWGAALRSGNPADLTAAALDWPRDENKIGNASFIFMQNQLETQGLELAREGVKTFPRSTSIWRLIFQNKSASIEERKAALEKMIELDPRNEELKRLLALAGPGQ